jgi:hypothetical protein
VASEMREWKTGFILVFSNQPIQNQTEFLQIQLQIQPTEIRNLEE